MIPYRIIVFSSRNVTNVLYIWMILAYCFPSIEKSFQHRNQGIRARVRDHILSLT